MFWASEDDMSGIRTLIDFSKRRVDGALTTWQQLRAQCDDAKQKLSALKQHGEGYHGIMRTGLQQGMPAGSTVAYLGFIGQIEAIVVRQESEVGHLEAACAQQWQELVDARREKRMYEILSERATARQLASKSRLRQAEVDELLQRAGKLR
jgi:flagellar export protein FliJ